MRYVTPCSFIPIYQRQRKKLNEEVRKFAENLGEISKFQAIIG